MELNRTSSMPKSVRHYELDKCCGDPNTRNSDNKNSKKTVFYLFMTSCYSNSELVFMKRIGEMKGASSMPTFVLR